jgi:signal peptidase I
MSNINFDFAVILTLLTLGTGVIWALDKWWLGPKRRAALVPGHALAAGVEDKPGPVVDFGRSFFPVILLVLLLRSFLAEPFRIPSGSMIPTLLIGDFILVNKFAYGLRDPVFHHKFVSFGEPQRGDIVVFRYPVNPSQDFIKRVIGVPGDRISYRNKQLFVNEQPMPLDADGVYTAGDSAPGVVYQFQESLGTVRHRIIVNPGRPAEDFEFKVPEGQYFMMGDNRDGSLDSRSWGTVPEGNLVGRAFFIWMSWDAGRFRPDWSRIGHTIN